LSYKVKKMRRLDLKVGFACNNNCRFCAQAHKRQLPSPSCDQLKHKINVAYQEGCDELVLTGGEPTVRDDLPEVVAFASEVGYDLIQIQSNGRMFSYDRYASKLIEAGATEFAFALHGPSPEIHDLQTRSQGSFDQTTEGILNLKQRGQRVLMNSVITRYNYQQLPDLVELLADFAVDQLQLAFVHPIGNCQRNFRQIVPKKKEVAPYLHQALDKSLERGYNPGTAMVEAFPLCLMEGYEAFCSEFYIPGERVEDVDRKIEDFADWRRSRGKKKGEKCRECRFDSVCEGPWREYVEQYGFTEFEPVAGDKIESLSELE